MESNVRNAVREFHAPQTMTPEELGDSLARLVWESFSDFVAESDPENAAEEALIFFMWAHTRGTQLAFIGRASDELVHCGLDVMHRAVFDDMALHGTPASQLPIFEQRVATRYSEYAVAAEVSDTRLGRAVVRHLTGREELSETVVRAIAERAIAVANPLRDFLEDVELID